MNTNTHTPKPNPAANQKTEAASDGATCWAGDARFDDENAPVCSLCDERLTLDNQHYTRGWADEYSHVTCIKQLNARMVEIGALPGRTDQPSPFDGGWHPTPPSSLPNAAPPTDTNNNHETN